MCGGMQSGMSNGFQSRNFMPQQKSYGNLVGTPQVTPSYQPRGFTPPIRFGPTDTGGPTGPQPPFRPNRGPIRFGPTDQPGGYNPFSQPQVSTGLQIQEPQLRPHNQQLPNIFDKRGTTTQAFESTLGGLKGNHQEVGSPHPGIGALQNMRNGPNGLTGDAGYDPSSRFNAYTGMGARPDGAEMFGGRLGGGPQVSPEFGIQAPQLRPHNQQLPRVSDEFQSRALEVNPMQTKPLRLNGAMGGGGVFGAPQNPMTGIGNPGASMGPQVSDPFQSKEGNPGLGGGGLFGAPTNPMTGIGNPGASTGDLVSSGQTGTGGPQDMFGPQTKANNGLPPNIPAHIASQITMQDGRMLYGPDRQPVIFDGQQMRFDPTPFNPRAGQWGDYSDPLGNGVTGAGRHQGMDVNMINGRIAPGMLGNMVGHPDFARFLQNYPGAPGRMGSLIPGKTF